MRQISLSQTFEATGADSRFCSLPIESKFYSIESKFCSQPIESKIYLLPSESSFCSLRLPIESSFFSLPGESRINPLTKRIKVHLADSCSRQEVRLLKVQSTANDICYAWQEGDPLRFYASLLLPLTDDDSSGGRNAPI